MQKEAKKILLEIEVSKLIDMDEVKEEAIKKGNKIVKDDTRAKVLIYAVKDTNYALIKGIRGSSWK